MKRRPDTPKCNIAKIFIVAISAGLRLIIEPKKVRTAKLQLRFEQE